MTGSRTGKLAMQPTPSVTRRVAAVSAPSSAIESGLGFASRLSPTHSESNTGLASTSRATVIICSAVVTPKNAPRWGSVNPKDRVAVVMAWLLRFCRESRAHSDGSFSRTVQIAPIPVKAHYGQPQAHSVDDGYI